MPLTVPPAPAAAVRSVTTALTEALNPPLTRSPDDPPAPASVRTPFPDGAGPAPSVGEPLPVHVLEPAAPGRAAPARLVGWRFPIRDGGRVLAVAETLRTGDGWAFSHFSAGPFLAATERALRQAEPLAAGHQGRMLSVPGLYMLCLWLHHDPAGGDDAQPAAADLLIPLAPAPPGVTAHHAYRAGDLLPLLAVRLTPPPLLGTAV